MKTELDFTSVKGEDAYRTIYLEFRIKLKPALISKKAVIKELNELYMTMPIDRSVFKSHHSDIFVVDCHNNYHVESQRNKLKLVVVSLYLHAKSEYVDGITTRAKQFRQMAHYQLMEKYKNTLSDALKGIIEINS